VKLREIKMIVTEFNGKKKLFRIKCACKACSKPSEDMHQACTKARKEGFVTIPGKTLGDQMVWVCSKCKSKLDGNCSN